MKTVFIVLAERSYRPFNLLTLSLILLVSLASCSPTEIVDPDTCECALTSGVVKDSAPDGSTAAVKVDTCMEPRPCDPEDLEVISFDEDSSQVTGAMKKELQDKGDVYALVDVRPDDKTWDPAITVEVVLNDPAPRDNFSLSILRWTANDWKKEGTAIAAKKDDLTAVGQISHTSLFAFVDETTAGVAPVTVPDILGLSLAEAIDRLRAAGLEIGPIVKRETDSAADAVIGMSPGPGREVKKDTPVEITISVAPVIDLVRVPDIIGLSLSAAEEALEKAGLFVSGSRNEGSEEEEDTVIDADPGIGTEVEPGTGIYLVLASTIPDPTCEVPDLIGDHVQDALAVLAAADCPAAGEQIAIESPQGEGTVVDMQPAPGTEVAVGTAVNLYYAIPQSCEVPDLIGDHVQDALAVLAAADCLDVGEPIAIESAQAEGTVIDMQPAPGTQVVVGTAVSLYYAIAETCEVPDLFGYHLDEATAVLAKEGCTIGNLIETPPEEFGVDERGIVLFTEPEAYTLIEKRTPVDIYVSEEPQKPSIVPELAGESIEEARRNLKAADLSIGDIIEVEPSDDVYIGGIVQYSEPRTGTAVPGFSPVDIYTTPLGDESSVDEYDEGYALADYFVNNLGASTASIIYDSGSDFSISRMQGFYDGFSEMGGEIIATYPAPGGTTDMSPVLVAIYAADLQSDILYFPVNDSLADLIVQQASEVGIDSVLVDAHASR